LPVNAAKAVDAMATKGVIGGVPYSRLNPNCGMDDVLLVAATETTTSDDIAALAKALKEVI
jgi:glycine dehydrogenase subunit 1